MINGSPLPQGEGQGEGIEVPRPGDLSGIFCAVATERIDCPAHTPVCSCNNRTYSQGRVKFPTGGMLRKERARERPPYGGVSRSGERPEPTVTVRMGEDKAAAQRSNERCVKSLCPAFRDAPVRASAGNAGLFLYALIQVHLHWRAP